MRALAACAAALAAASSFAQGEVKPTNDLPNPYRSVAPWGKLPEGRSWGALNAVGIDNDGTSLWVADRCGANPDRPAGASPFLYDTCANSSLPPVLKFDAAGNLVRSFGAGMFVFPHKIYMDRDGNVWVVDMRAANERELAKGADARGKGHTVVKFSPEGAVLLTIGMPGVAGDPPEALTEPCSVVVAPNGDVFVAEGHSGQYPSATPNTVGRISRYSKDGTFIKSFGRWGAGPGEFKTPHDITMDGQGRLIVADRGNNRLQVLDQDGNYLGEWRQFSRPSGVAIGGDLIYVTDSESNASSFAHHPGWERGIRVGRLADGEVLYLIPDRSELKDTSGAEGVAVDADGNVYGGEVGQRQLVKHVR
jgi:sugar lactone lactonase YvrE